MPDPKTSSDLTAATDATDAGYDAATRRNDGQGTIPEMSVEEEAVDDASDESTDDNALDDIHSVDDLENKLKVRRDPGDINQNDNEAEWSMEPAPTTPPHN